MRKGHVNLTQTVTIPRQRDNIIVCTVAILGHTGTMPIYMYSPFHAALCHHGNLLDYRYTKIFRHYAKILCHHATIMYHQIFIYNVHFVVVLCIHVYIGTLRMNE